MGSGVQVVRRLILAVLISGCTNAAGLADDECVTVVTTAGLTRCFVLCDVGAGSAATNVRAIPCPTTPERKDVTP